VSSKSKKKHRPANVSEVSRSVLTMFLWAYCDVYDPSVEDMQKMSEAIQSVQDSLLTGRLKMSEIREALWDEYGWKVVES
jgi:hypothetical protein